MSERGEHRKTIRHYDGEGHVHELTFSCIGRRPHLDDDRRRRILSGAIDAATERCSYDLVAFVYMPEHVHLLVWPRSAECRIAELLFAVKRQSSYRIKEFLLASDPQAVEKLTDRAGIFRFWQQGPGYDRNLINRDSVRAAAEYIHNNPVRRGLCPTPADWKWSSWKHYLRPDLADDLDLPVIHGPPF
jgi:putative transposase